MIAVAGDLAVSRRGPVALDGFTDSSDWATVLRIHCIHCFQYGSHLAVVVSVFQGEDIPTVRSPLTYQIVAFETGRNYTTDLSPNQAIIDACIVVRNHYPQSLSHLQRKRLCLELLRMPFCERKFALERDHFRRLWRACHVPKGCFPRGRGNANAGGAAVHVVGAIGTLRMSGEGTNATPLSLCEQGMIFQTSIMQQRFQGTGTASEPERVDWQHRDVGIDMVTRITALLILPI